jgi:hypothetical protein
MRCEQGLACSCAIRSDKRGSVPPPCDRIILALEERRFMPVNISVAAVLPSRVGSRIREAVAALVLLAGSLSGSWDERK